MTETERRGKLAEQPYAYFTTATGETCITWRGRVVTILRGARAARFLTRVGDASTPDAQLLMAKATGNFKHGNERRGPS